jgi:hypothetical protein
MLSLFICPSDYIKWLPLTVDNFSSLKPDIRLVLKLGSLFFFSVKKVIIAQRRYFNVFAYKVNVASCYHLKYLMIHEVKHKTYMELTLKTLVSSPNLVR